MQPTIKAGVKIECPVCRTKNDVLLCVDICEVEKTGVRKCMECEAVLYYTVDIICTVKESTDMLREVRSEDDLPY